MIPAHRRHQCRTAEPGPGVRAQQVGGLRGPGFVRARSQTGALTRETQVRGDVWVARGQPAGAFVVEDRVAGAARAQFGVAEVEQDGGRIAVVLQHALVALDAVGVAAGREGAVGVVERIGAGK